MEKETSCLNTKAIFEYVKAKNNGDCSGLLGDLDPEIDCLPNPEDFLMDTNNWVSCALISKLYARARRVLNDDATPYHIAKYALENSNLGFLQKIFAKRFFSYKKAAKNLQIINHKFNRNKEVELVKKNNRSAVIRLHWDSKMSPSKDICINNQGIYTFFPLIWQGKAASLKEVCCYFEGAPYCEYHLKWPVRNIFHEIFSRLFPSRSILMDTIEEMEKDKKKINEKYEEINKLNEELNDKIDQLMVMQETGRAILSALDLQPLLTVIMNLLSTVCEINRAFIMLVNEKEQVLEYVHGLGFGDAIPDSVKNYRVPLDHTQNLLVKVVNTRIPEYISDIDNSTLKQENIMMTKIKPTSIYVGPLTANFKAIGVIVTDAINGKGVPKKTREMLYFFAPQIAIAIQNARLYSRLQEQMAEIRHSYAQINRAEKLSFVGNLAARLAHEIKNPMTAIGSFIQLLPRKFDDEEFRKEFYGIAIEELERVNTLITELTDLAKPKKSPFAFYDLNNLIEKMVSLVSSKNKLKGITVIRQFDRKIGMVWLNEEKMKEAILNILSNALEAIPEGGRIEILTRKSNPRCNPKSINIEIKDNGIGIPENIIDKIFDPYFTTKHNIGIHNGAGLGLHICLQNMQDHGGRVEVKSKVNEGTTFILSLPANNGIMSS